MLRQLAPTALIVMLLGTSSCLHGTHELEPNEHGEKPVAVEAEPVREMRMEQILRSIGTTSPLPSNRVIVAPAVEGIVAEILVDEGDEVKAGQPIVRVDDRLAQRELAERKAARAELEAQATLLKAPPRPEEQHVADMEVERARVAEELAQTVVDRLIPLNRRKEISDQQLFEAQQKQRDAKLARQVAEGHRTVLMLGPKAEAVAEVEAKIARADAAIMSAETRLAYFTLTSPRPGYVEKINCHPGQLLAVGTVAAEVLDWSQVRITVGVPARDAALLRNGQEARILDDHDALDAASHEAAGHEEEEEPLVGKIVFIGAEATSETGTVPVHVHVSNHDQRLRLHTVVALEIVVNVVPDALVVPESAVVELEEGPTIAIVHEGKAEILHPKVGLRQHGLIQVIDDELHAGDLVITRGGYNLPEDTPLKVVSEEKGNGDEP
jgi:RND family efflux transporter MFP subunit